MELERFLSEEDKQRVNDAVVEAEKGTSAEIVPVLTDASGSYDRGEDLFGMLCAVVAVIIAWSLFQKADPTAPWSTPENPVLHYSLPHVIVTMIAAFIVGVVLASRLWFIRYLFTSRAEMIDCVRRGADVAFHRLGIRRTKDATGVLIYVSVFEHMVHVVGDGAVAEVLTEDDYAAVRDAVIDGFRRGDRVGGLCAGIAEAGNRLSAVLPKPEGNEDELPNELVVLQQNL